MDFFKVSVRSPKQGTIEIYPTFIIKSPSNDLMIRGGDFYAVWRSDLGLWSTNEQDAIDMVDHELDIFAEENRTRYEGSRVKVLHMWDADSGSIDRWHRYCQKQMRDCFHILDEKIIFSNSHVIKKDYASKKLGYPLQSGDYSAWDKLIGTLYSPDERHKIEWAIGSIVSGDSKKLQKFMVLYGEAGTGKSTVLNVIQQLFDGYFSVFDARALGSSSSAFALEPFKCNPLVGIQHDGDLSRIEDNTRLNSLVSHETMTVNNKFEKLYSTKFKAFLFMGTNKPVKITDAKSGLLRRLIDVTPTGDKIPRREYNKLVKQVEFELGAIAQHCLDIYLENPGAYDDYVPIAMMGESNDFFNFMEDSYLIFKNEDGTTLKQAWELYKNFCEDAKLGYPLNKTRFKAELRNYFREFYERWQLEDGTRVRNYYSGFRRERFQQAVVIDPDARNDIPDWLDMRFSTSIFDEAMIDCPAQYASENGKPLDKWDDISTTLESIDTKMLHYVKVPEDHIVIDFDIPDPETGEKSFKLNAEAASKWPPTYAELSKSGQGIHLHYLYSGNPRELSRVYDEHIEIKVFTGNSSLRRKLTKCNDIPIETISSGLPLKERSKKMVNTESIKSEKGLRNLIVRNLNKEIHPSTKPSIDFIFKILEDAYQSGMKYDVSDMRQGILAFAANSTNQSDYCIKTVMSMKFKSDEPSEITESIGDRLIFYDVEVFPNLFLVNWKFKGDAKVIRMINPSPHEVEELMQYRLVGFNCRRYDNHLLYARMMGYDNEKLYSLSQRIINTKKGEKGPFFGEAYNISYTDVYDFAAKKQSLKKWEIELGIHHQELGLPWDQPVPEELWTKVAEYCDNDVIATEAVFDKIQADFVARQILSLLARMTVNDTTNSLTTRIIFGKNKKPQSQFNYRNMGDVKAYDGPKTYELIKKYDLSNLDPDYTMFDSKGRPIFPGYVYENGVSTYREEEVGEGGYVYAEPDIHTMVGLDDVMSMHPSTIEDEVLFGEEYTKNFSDIKKIRIHVKHGEFKEAEELLRGLLISLHGVEYAEYALKLLKPYLTEEYIDSLAYALKIAINSVYGLTAAKFENPFRDPRNVDNIVAKRGALFMVNLKHEVQKRGFRVAHIKTDSIKIPNATPDILDFVYRYGKMYGYTFEHEATYEKMCLVNDAVYIAKYLDPDKCSQIGYFDSESGTNYIPADNLKHFKKHKHPWTATGTQFQVPYVFKTLFSKEPIEFADMCETKEVKKGNLYLDMNASLPDVTGFEKELDKLREKYRKGLISDTVYEPEQTRLEEEIAKGHNYVFVGRVGSFCPFDENGTTGGALVCLDGDRQGAATGTKGYRWLEAEMVQKLEKENDISLKYYTSLCDEAIETIDKFGDFEWFVGDDNIDIQQDLLDVNVIPYDVDDEVPFAEDKK